MSKSKLEKLGSVLKKHVKPDPKFGSAPVFENYDRIIFMDKDKEKEWEDLNPSVKKSYISNLKETCDKMENKVAIEFLCHVINDLSKRIDRLEIGIKEKEINE